MAWQSNGACGETSSKKPDRVNDSTDRFDGDERGGTQDKGANSRTVLSSALDCCCNAKRRTVGDVHVRNLADVVRNDSRLKNGRSNAMG